jgi:hypothetical protein
MRIHPIGATSPPSAYCSNQTTTEILALNKYVVGMEDVRYLASVTAACAKRTSAAASVERKRRKPDGMISPE